MRGSSWFLVFKYQDRQNGETRLHIKDFKGPHPWDLGFAQNLRQVIGSRWWEWLFFWWQPERVRRYGHYSDMMDLPYADWVLRYRTEFLMPPLTGVVIDDSGACPSPRQAASLRRQQQRSSALSSGSLPMGTELSARRIRRSGGASASHAEEPNLPTNPGG